jgi:hypothetical protein
MGNELRDALSTSQKVALVKIETIVNDLIDKGFERDQAQIFMKLLEQKIQRRMIVSLNRDAFDFVEVIEKDSEG